MPEIVDSIEVYVHDLPELLIRERPDILKMVRPRIVHKDVDLAVLFEAELDDIVDMPLVREVAAQEPDLTALSLNKPLHF
jgi:hypothetical protein